MQAGARVPIGSTDSISRVLDREGLDGEALVLRATQAPAKEALRSATRRAIDQGVFGVPTMIVDGELFWGSDQSVTSSAGSWAPIRSTPSTSSR